MAHYKDNEKGQGLFLTINLSERLVPGSFEYTLTRLVDNMLRQYFSENNLQI